MAPKTSQLLGLSPAEMNAAVFTTLGEAGPGLDPYGVFATILSRRQSGKYGSTIPQIVKAPNQFVANDRYTIQQVTDPNYGRKVYGKRFDEMVNRLENPNELLSILPRHGGATEFRGQSALGKKKPGDVMFDPLGNFFLPESRNSEAQKSLMSMLKRGGTQATTTTTPDVQQAVQKGNTQANSLLNRIMKYIPLGNLFPNQSSIDLDQQMPLTDLSGQSFLNAYKQMFGDDEELV